MKHLFITALLALSFYGLNAQNEPLNVFAQNWANDSCGCTGFRSRAVSYDASTGSTLVQGMTFVGMDYSTVHCMLGDAQIFHQQDERTFVCCYTLYDYDKCGDMSQGWKNLKLTYVDGMVADISVVYFVHEYNGTAMAGTRDNVSM
jgi:hypothetical protein